MISFKNALLVVGLSIGFAAQASVGSKSQEPMALQLNSEGSIIEVKLRTEEAEQYQKLRKRRMLVLNDEIQFYSEMNWMLNRERLDNERLLQQQLRFSAADAEKFGKMIEGIRLAVETQQQLEDRFGHWPPRRLTLLLPDEMK